MYCQQISLEIRLVIVVYSAHDTFVNTISLNPILYSYTRDPGRVVVWVYIIYYFIADLLKTIEQIKLRG